VAATPDTVRTLRKEGYKVIVEKDAGFFASFSDDMY